MPSRSSKVQPQADPVSEDDGYVHGNDDGGDFDPVDESGALSDAELAQLESDAVASIAQSAPTEREHALQIAVARLPSISTHSRRVDAVLNAYYKDQRVARIFRSLPFVGRLDGYRDEARQRVAVLFLERYVDRMIREQQPAEFFYRLLYALAMNMLRTIRREAQRSDDRHRVLIPQDAAIESSGVRDNGLHAVSETAIAGDTETLESTERRIDMERAQREIAKRMAAKTSAKSSISDAPTPSIERPGSGNVLIGGVLELQISPKMLHSPSASEEDVKVLLELRTVKALTNLELAEQLDCTAAALASYIGRRVPPPERIVTAAHVLLNAAKRKRSPVAKLSLDELFESWVSLLGIQALGSMEQNKRIGEVIGRDGSTVYRWRTKRVEMPARELEAFHERIKSAAMAV